MYPGAQEIGGSGDLDYPRAGAPELLGDRLRQRVITADDDFAVHDLALLTRTRLWFRKLADKVSRDIRPLLCVLRHSVYYASTIASA
jgi:hypothetical protein